MFRVSIQKSTKRYMIKSKDKFHELNMFLKDLDSKRHSKSTSLFWLGYALSINGIIKAKELDFGTEELFIQPTRKLPEKITAKDILDKIKQESINAF